MSSTKISNIPHFLRAGSAEGLRKAMLKNNVKWGLIFNYYQIVYDGKNWYAWFQLNAEDFVAEEMKQIEARGKGSS